MNIHTVINLRGLREQSFRFALSRTMKGCFTKGCEIFTPLEYALKGVDCQHEITYLKKFTP